MSSQTCNDHLDDVENDDGDGITMWMSMMTVWYAHEAGSHYRGYRVRPVCRCAYCKPFFTLYMYNFQNYFNWPTQLMYFLP